MAKNGIKITIKSHTMVQMNQKLDQTCASMVSKSFSKRIKKFQKLDAFCLKKLQFFWLTEKFPLPRFSVKSLCAPWKIVQFTKFWV